MPIVVKSDALNMFFARDKRGRWWHWDTNKEWCRMLSGIYKGDVDMTYATSMGYLPIVSSLEFLIKTGKSLSGTLPYYHFFA